MLRVPAAGRRGVPHNPSESPYGDPPPVAVPEILCSHTLTEFRPLPRTGKRYARIRKAPTSPTAATPYCSLYPPQAALANVPPYTGEPWGGVRKCPPTQGWLLCAVLLESFCVNFIGRAVSDRPYGFYRHCLHAAGLGNPALRVLSALPAHNGQKRQKSEAHGEPRF